MRLRLLIAAVLLALGLTGQAAAHEVRPAYLEITERADGKADILWKQPSIGLLAVAIDPQIQGDLLKRAPDSAQSAENFEIRRWRNVDLGGKGLDKRQVKIAGLERTITDTLVLVRLKDGDQISQVLTPAAPGFTIDAHAGAAVPAYLVLGIEHILTGIDHLLFVFGLLLLSSGWRQLLKTITAFTVAHSITLALTALKLISVNPQLIEAMVAYSILFLAVELMRKQRGYDGITQRRPWLIAFGFGLLHGAAFAGALKEIGLPEGNIPASLFLFNVGVEIGQLVFVGICFAAIRALKHIRWPERTPRLAWTAASYAIGSFAMFWFLERLHTALDVALA
ncbi:MAG: HupE/UreJ family protein [Candidatus Andeanibacterium colombiense]|uniref:HupE/UreJ family protein n=1 Tax=Candidatus Andeanibacterium colombiense TaxID=3121345 RepID=A0AAJ6BPA5_9SPHN|nr:MAG: HupE/UreJ family protein [Sphingomonadaceae bacterium]